MIEVRLPQFGMGMSDGTIIAWHKSEGEYVDKGEPLCDIEAAKTTVEYASPQSGILARIVVKVDENVAVDTVIAAIDPSGKPSADVTKAAADRSSSELREEADVPPGVQIEPEADRRVSPLARRVAEQEGISLADIEGSGARGRITRRDVLDSERSTERQVEPRARRAAKELGMDLAAVEGSGPGGRVIEEDVRAMSGADAKASSQAPAPNSGSEGSDTVGFVEIPHSMMRRTIARRLTESKSTVPHFYISTSCQLDALLSLRTSLNVEIGHKVSVNDLIIRAVALALIDNPDANVQFDEKVMRKYSGVDVAVAVATPRGLVTPIVRAVHGKSVRDVAADVKELAGRAKEGKLKPEEYSGGTRMW